MKPKVSRLRREPDTELKVYSLSLPTNVVELLEEYNVKSGRGKGNLSAFLEISALITIGLFDNPEMARNYLLCLMDNPVSLDLYKLAENLEELAKRLLDILE